MPTYGSMWPIYRRYWDSMLIKTSRENELKSACERALINKVRYMAVQMITGVPWEMTAILHMRESNANFNMQHGQGNPLNKVSVNVPKNMGPYITWEESAVDIYQVKKFNKVIDWRLEKILYHCEMWNGWGYWDHHGQMPSPFVWAATNIQKRGKYTSDGKFDATEMDSQLGCAPMLQLLQRMNRPVAGVIEFVRET